MHSPYQDITDRIEEEPKWWDADGVPRYADPHPDHCPNIYADKVVFYRIACQACGHEFLVQMHTSQMDRMRHTQWMKSYGHEPTEWNPLTLHYGDPPNYGCCPAGPTMNSCPRELVALWERRTEDQPDWEWKITKSNIPVRADWDVEVEAENGPWW